MLSPATQFRSAEDMSRMAPFVDAASWIDRTNWPNTFISYYVYGAALGLGLDFSIREKTGNAKSLDDVMRALWKTHGKVGGREVGLRRCALHRRRRANARSPRSPATRRLPQTSCGASSRAAR